MTHHHLLQAPDPGIFGCMDARMLAEVVADAWATRRGLTPLTYERPDERIRRAQAVDLLGRNAGGRPVLVLEHTLVESFLDQRSASIAAIRMFEPLERVLQGTLPTPGHFKLAVEPTAVVGLKRKVEEIRSWVERWIRETAETLVVGEPGMAPRHFATVTVPDTALKVSLYRWKHCDGDFGLVFNAPGPEENALMPSLRRAIGAKCPKLAAAKNGDAGTESLLLFEIHDLALGNLFDLDAVVQAGLTSWVQDVPDHLWLVDTTDNPASVMISKEGGRVGEAIIDRFLPFRLRPASAEHNA